jgi:hypothetical protein
MLTTRLISMCNLGFLDSPDSSCYIFVMEKLSPIEIRVKTLVDAFFADKITRTEFKRELDTAKVRPRRDRKAERIRHQGPRH